MANFVYTGAKLKIAKGDLDFDSADIRVKLCMSNTSADTDQDATNLTGITTIDEYDGSGYSEIDLAGASVAADNANNRAEVDYTDGSFGAAVGAGTRSWVGMLIYCRVDGTAGNDFPVAWHDLSSNNGNGGAVDLAINAEGLLQIT